MGGWRSAGRGNAISGEPAGRSAERAAREEAAARPGGPATPAPASCPTEPALKRAAGSRSGWARGARWD